MLKNFLPLAILMTLVIYSTSSLMAQTQNNTELINRLTQITSGDFDDDQNPISNFKLDGYGEKEEVSSDSIMQELLADTVSGLKFYQELPYMGLNGEVEKVVIQRFNAAYDENKNPIIKSKKNGSPDIIQYTEIYFDEHGYPTQSLEKTYKNGVEETVRKRMTYLGPQLLEMTEVNAKNVESKTVYNGPIDGYDVYTMTRKGWKNVTIKNKYNFKKQQVTTYTVDDLGNKMTLIKRMKGHKPVYIEQIVSDQLNNKAQYKYNSKGLLRRVVEVVVDTKPFVRFYNYANFDNHNNWLARIFVYPNGVPIWIEKVEYTYRYTEPVELNEDEAIIEETENAEETVIETKTETEE